MMHVPRDLTFSTNGVSTDTCSVPKIIANKIERLLRERITAGDPSATGRLESERHLAAEYGVPRNTIRKAVNAIARDGILERRVGRGTPLGDAMDELVNILETIVGSSPADLIAVRLIIEPQAAALAAINASSSDVDAITETHYHVSEGLKADQFEHRDSLFHRRIFEAARNDLLLHLHDILRGVRSWRSFSASKRDRFCIGAHRRHWDQHANIVSALRGRDADAAAQAMFQHIKAI
jgi:DNA-binding FadR family transcriptional regulator